VAPSVRERLLFAIVLLLFAIQVTLVGGGQIGVLIGAFAILVALSGITRARPPS
jgi:hypothetical protein